MGKNTVVRVAVGSQGDEGLLDHAHLLNDILNTSVMAALIGGFALNSMNVGDAGETLDYAAYVLTCIAVHACTCSAITSAFLYRLINSTPEEGVFEFQKRYKLLLMVPVAKFGGGCICYLISVVIRSWQDLKEKTFPRMLVLVVGVGSVSMVFMTLTFINRISNDRKCAYKPS
jgi:hypothetical protein